MKKLTIICGTLLIVCVFFAGCGKTDTPSGNSVWMQNISFNPSSLTVPVNATVTWTNKDGMTHNVTSDSGWFASGNINQGGTYSHQFTSTGTFTYRCTIHAGMTGKIIVQ
jgi:plastocyanin